MRCVLIPSASVEIGCDGPDAPLDEHPNHVVRLDSFVIDAEPVSTTAYCRVLNSTGPVYPEVHQDWFVLDPQDDRHEHMLVTLGSKGWQPAAGDRFMADDPCVVVRRQRLLAVGQRQGLEQATEMTSGKSARELPAE